MKVLLAVDGSPCSDLAVAEVVQRAWPAGTVVQVTSVEAPVDPSLLREAATAFEVIAKQQKAATARCVTSAMERLQQGARGLTVLPRMLEGSPEDEIVAEAVRWGADLIVVGSHGYGPIRQFFLGSVSLYVAQNAPCSVLIVRGSRDTSDASQGS